MEVTIEPTKNYKELAKLNESVQSWHNELFPKEFKPFDLAQIESAFERMMSDPNTFAFVARAKEVAIGYLLCIIKSNDESEFQYAKTVLVVDQISVEKAYRKSGIAQQLFDSAISLAEEKGITEIQIDHWDGNLPASKFFIKNGFHYFKHRMRKTI